MYLEDYVPGQGKISPGRTISSADLDLFAEWTGDPDVANQRAADGRRLASGQMLVNLADMLVQRIGCVEGTGFCNLGWTWKFNRPVHEWDTIWVRTRWNNTRRSKSIQGVGIVNMTLTLLNQKDEEVAEAIWNVMILSRSAPPAWKAA
jgi:acyl dehydratase